MSGRRPLLRRLAVPLAVREPPPVPEAQRPRPWKLATGPAPDPLVFGPCCGVCGAAWHPEPCQAVTR